MPYSEGAEHRICINSIINNAPSIKPLKYKEVEKEMTKDEKEEIGKDAEDDIIEVQEALKIADGAHSGTIVNAVHEARGDEGQYDYLDIYVDTIDDNENEVTIKTGFPFYISESSGLGGVLYKSGMKFNAGDKIGLSDIKKQLTERKIIFQTFTEDKFARIMNNTIKFE